MAHVTLTDDVRSVLENATINDNTLILNGQLDRLLYAKVNKALENAGGKWNRHAKGHVFQGNPREKLGLMLETGVSLDQKKIFQAFYTPQNVAEIVVTEADVKGRTCLEPSAGEGALALEMRKQGAIAVTCVEMNEEACLKLAKHNFDALIKSNFLEVKPFTKFDRVVMNPPFTKNQDIKHVQHALEFVKEGGKLVSIMAGNTERKQFEKFLDDLYLKHHIVDLPEGSFKESGTNVNTIMLVIQL